MVMMRFIFAVWLALAASVVQLGSATAAPEATACEAAGGTTNGSMCDMPDGRSCEASDDSCIGADADADADAEEVDSHVEHRSTPMFEEQDEESESTASGEE
jgi:hypothetical protein